MTEDTLKPTSTGKRVHHERRPTHFLQKYKEDESQTHPLLKDVSVAVNVHDSEEVQALKRQVQKLLDDLKESKQGCAEIATMWKKERDEKRELEEAKYEIENEIKHHRNVNKKIEIILEQSNEVLLNSPTSVRSRTELTDAGSLQL